MSSSPPESKQSAYTLPAEATPAERQHSPPPPSAIGSLWDRLKRHKVVQWTVAYLAVAYTLLHGAEMLGGSLGWPHGWLRVFTLLLILGIPVVVTLSWYHGARGQQRVSGTEVMIIALLLAVGGAVLWRDNSTEHDADVSGTNSPARGCIESGRDADRPAARRFDRRSSVCGSICREGSAIFLRWDRRGDPQRPRPHRRPQGRFAHFRVSVPFGGSRDSGHSRGTGRTSCARGQCQKGRGPCPHHCPIDRRLHRRASVVRDLRPHADGGGSFRHPG